MILTQPVMVQSLQDEFKLYTHGKNPMTPDKTGKVLSKGENKVSVSKEEQKTYISGIGKMLHMMKWSIPDILNSIRKCLMIMICTMETHIKAITLDRGILLKPNEVWNGGRYFIFGVTSMRYSKYEKDDLKKSVSGWYTSLNGAAKSFRIKWMPIISLSVTEADLFSAVMCAKKMLFVMRILNSM